MSLSHSPSIVRDGLVMYLDAANPKSYPGTGTTWTDLSGNGNDSVITTGAFNANGYFESVNAAPSLLHITTPASASISSALEATSGGWTIEEIVLVSDTTYPEAFAGTSFGTTPYNAGSIGIDWGHGTATNTALNLTINDGTTLIRTNVSLSATQSQYNKWICRTLIFDRTNGQVRVYYDGVYQVSLDISTITGVVYNGTVLSWGTLYGWSHDGSRAAIRLYSSVLTAAEVKQNFEATRSRFGI